MSALTSADAAALTAEPVKPAAVAFPRREVVALLTITFLFPALVCLFFLPTPTDDLREQINIGLNFPLYTWKNPPLQSWLAGLIALVTGARDAWPYMLVAQAINGVALGYLVAFAYRFISKATAAPVAIAFCLTTFAALVVPSTALNADQIQTPLWLGLLYHTLAGAEDRRLRHWVMAGIFAGLGLLAKYYVLLFMGVFALVLLARPATRTLLLRPGPWLAVAIAAAIVSPHAMAILGRTDQFGYGMDLIQFQAPLMARLRWFADFLMTGIHIVPLLVALGICWLRGDRAPVVAPPTEAARIVIAVTVILTLLIAVLIFAIGFRVRTRYGEPAMPLLLLAAFSMLRFEGPLLVRFARTALWVWAIKLVGVLILVHIFVVGNQRDPADSAAAIIRAEWDARYTCGPAYVLGHMASANAIGLYMGPGVTGGSTLDFRYAHWIDRQRLKAFGAVIVESADSLGHQPLSRYHPPAAGPLTDLTLPYRNFWRGDTHTYLYRFVPPQDCPERDR